MIATEQREAFICSHIGLVHNCARRFIGRGIEYDDLFQAGCEGLVKAADGFDTDRGLQFSTYAVPVILGEMRRLFREAGTVKVSRSLKELAMHINRTREQILIRSGQEPTIAEIAAQLAIEPTEVALAMSAAQPPLSLTRQDDEEESDQIDLPTPSHEEQVTTRLALQQLLSQMTPRDRELIIHRYIHHRTQQTTADLLGMTQVQVSRRERVLLQHMRDKLIG